MLARAELRATEEALRRWMTAAALVRSAADGGRVVVMAESVLAPVQALVRWDPVWHARQELAARAELGFPPAVRMASVDGSPAALADFLLTLRLPEVADVLGPVPLEGRAGDSRAGEQEERERALVRAPREHGRELATVLFDALKVRTARKDPDPVRVRLDPLELV
jgi:primosomal protein N' (replication factor Y)